MKYIKLVVCWVTGHDWYSEKGAKRKCGRCGRVEILAFNSCGERAWVEHL